MGEGSKNGSIIIYYTSKMSFIVDEWIKMVYPCNGILAVKIKSALKPWKDPEDHKCI